MSRPKINGLRAVAWLVIMLYLTICATVEAVKHLEREEPTLSLAFWIMLPFLCACILLMSFVAIAEGDPR